MLIPDRDFENVGKWRVGLEEIGGAGNVLVTSYPADPSWNGSTLAQLAIVLDGGSLTAARPGRALRKRPRH